MAMIESPIWEIDTVIPVGSIQGLFTRLGATGFYLDPYTSGVVFANTGGAQPAVIDGQVARIDSPSGSPVAASFTNGTASKCPTLKADGLELDDVDDYLSMPDNAALRFGTTSFTIAIAIRPSVITGSSEIMSKRGTGVAGGKPGWGLRQQDAGVQLEYDYTGSVANPPRPITTTNALTAGTWANVIAQLDYPGAAATGFINNVQSATVAVTVGDITGDRPIAIGIDPTDFTTFPFGGRIGRIVVIDKLLSTADRTLINDWIAQGHA